MPPKPILILNGPNLNLLGKREPEIYGHTSLNDIKIQCEKQAANANFTIKFEQSNLEGALIDSLHEARTTTAGVIINAGAYTHTSIAIYDALKALAQPIIEVHLSNIFARESFRHHSYISPVAHGIICGFGAKSYELALEAIIHLIQKDDKKVS